MENLFELTFPKLTDIALAFAAGVKEGLARNDAAI